VVVGGGSTYCGTDTTLLADSVDGGSVNWS